MAIQLLRTVAQFGQQLKIPRNKRAFLVQRIETVAI